MELAVDVMQLLLLSLLVGVLFQPKCLQVGYETLQLDVIIGRNCFGFEQVERIVEPPAERLEQHGVLLDEASLFLVRPDHNRQLSRSSIGQGISTNKRAYFFPLNLARMGLHVRYGVVQRRYVSNDGLFIG